MSQIDVAVTCYNYGGFLRQCVESVLGQSHKDLRVLIIDDASTDTTPAICTELAAQDSRLAISRHAVNHGHIKTYNEAIEWAQAEYFLLLSADDYLLPGALERAIAVLDADPSVGLVLGSYVIEGPRNAIRRAVTGDDPVIILDPGKFIDGLAVRNWVSTATAVVRTSLQKQLGGYLAELPHSGDLEMWLRFAVHSRVAYINQPQAAYRRHERNMSMQYLGRPDFEQCKIPFFMHFREIRQRLPNGTLLEISVRRHLGRRARALIKDAKCRGNIAGLSSLFAFLYFNRLTYNIMELRHRFGLLERQ
jgi:glycosyltransferase involved in cell wall biosynthesis